MKATSSRQRFLSEEEEEKNISLYLSSSSGCWNVFSISIFILLVCLLVVVVVDPNECQQRRRSPSARGCCHETREELCKSTLIMFLRPAGRRRGRDLGAAQDEAFAVCSSQFQVQFDLKSISANILIWMSSLF